MTATSAPGHLPQPDLTRPLAAAQLRPLRPVGRVLRADEVGLYRDAETALARAETEAARIRITAMREADVIRAKARAAAEINEHRTASKLLIETSANVQRELAMLPVQVAEAIAAAVARVIGGLDLADAIARAARRALTDLAEQHATIQVRVAPAVADTVRIHLAAPAMVRDGAGGLAATVRVIADPSLPADGCILETAAGFVRATLSEQLEALHEVLVAEAARSNNDQSNAESPPS